MKLRVLKCTCIVIQVFSPVLSLGCRMSCNSNVTRLQLSSVSQAQRAPVHLMPCEIEHNGSAQVSQYFTATIKDREHGTVRMSFFWLVLKGEMLRNRSRHALFCFLSLGPLLEQFGVGDNSLEEPHK